MDSKAIKVLVAEDDEDILELLRLTLSANGFAVTTSATGLGLPDKVKKLAPDLVLLDIMLPGLDGFGICKRLRADPETATVPIIMLTARTAETDRIYGLELGADDYVVKPFSPTELVLRIKAILRRNHVTPDKKHIVAGPVTLDASQHRAYIDGVELNLTVTEFRLLLDLMSNMGIVRDREQLLSGAWADLYDGGDRTVDTHIRRLRKKMDSASQLIETVRGVGYRFKKPNSLN